MFIIAIFIQYSIGFTNFNVCALVIVVIILYSHIVSVFFKKNWFQKYINFLRTNFVGYNYIFFVDVVFIY